MHSTPKPEFVSTETGEIFHELGAGRVETPTSNTGFPGASFDWLAGTLMADDALGWLKELFGANGWEESGRGGKFYYKRYQKGNIAVLCEGVNAHMGTRLELTGQGCREVEAQQGFEGWRVLLSLLHEKGMRCTRLDVALDDHAGRLDLAVLREKMVREEVATHYEHWEDMRSGKIRKRLDSDQFPARVGETLQIGKRSGNSCVRFYDWQAKHGGDEQFIRCELQLNKRLAHAMFERIVEGGGVGPLAAGFLTRSLLFKEPADTPQKTRWETCAWWSAFLEGVQAVRLSTRPVAATLDRARKWVLTQVAATLALLQEQAPEPDFIQDVLRHGAELMKKRGKHFERIRVEGWKKGFARCVEEPDPFWNTVENVRARFLHDYRAAGAVRA